MTRDYSNPYPYESERDQWLSQSRYDEITIVLSVLAAIAVTVLFWVVATT